MYLLTDINDVHCSVFETLEQCFDYMDKESTSSPRVKNNTLTRANGVFRYAINVTFENGDEYNIEKLDMEAIQNGEEFTVMRRSISCDDHELLAVFPSLFKAMEYIAQYE